MKVLSNISGALLRGLLLTLFVFAPSLRGMAEEPRVEAPSPEETVPPVGPGDGEEVPEEMVEFLLMMELLDDYGDVIDVEVEVSDEEQKE